MEQSQKLIELGIDVNTADMYWDYDYDIQQGYKYYPKVMDEQFDDICIPAWSLAALMHLLPEHVQVPPYLTQNKYRFSKNNGFIEFGDNYHTEKSTNPLDAIFEMVVWLKENGKL